MYYIVYISTNIHMLRDNVNLNFRVPPTFHRDFKVAAAERHISMVELLHLAFAILQRQPTEAMSREYGAGTVAAPDRENLLKGDDDLKDFLRSG